LRELLNERVELGLPFPFQLLPPEQTLGDSSSPHFAAKEIIGHLDSVTNPEQIADLVSFTVLTGAKERQEILEILDVETRLRRLINFLLAEIRQRRNRHGA